MILVRTAAARSDSSSPRSCSSSSVPGSTDYTADRATPRAGSRRSTPATLGAPPTRRSSTPSAPTPSCSSVTVTEEGGGSVTYRDGSHAEGFRWGPGHDGLEPGR